MTDHGITIRIATIDDAEAVTELTRLAYAKWVPIIDREPLPMKADHHAAIRDHRVDLLYLGAHLAALIETVRRDGDLLIENVAVAPPFQGRGIGRQLIKHVERLAQEVGVDSVRLYTNARFETNLRFYAALGYELEREQRLNGGVAIHLVKRLSDHAD